MCFSNLPIEFDDEGNPHLAEDAEDVEHPACGCGEDMPALDEDDPEDAFADIVESVPEEVKAHLGESGPADRDDSGEDPTDRPAPRTEAGGD